MQKIFILFHCPLDGEQFIFLLGEIWHDSDQWLHGDKYNSTMNHPFLECLHNFWLDDQDSRELKFTLNRCYSMYPE